MFGTPGDRSRAPDEETPRRYQPYTQAPPVTHRPSLQPCPSAALHQPPKGVIQLRYNLHMTTINTIEDLARILRDQPTWAEALRALLLSQDLLDLPGRFNRFVEAQQETNRLTAQRLDGIDTHLNSLDGRMDNLDGRMDSLDGRMDSLDRKMDSLDRKMDSLDRKTDNLEGHLGNLQGGQYERSVRNKALARSVNALGFEGPYVALNQDGLTDPRLTSAIAQAIRDGLVTHNGSGDLYEAALIISDQDNRHAVFEVSLTADQDDIDRAKTRAGILAAITQGAVTPVVITSRLNPAQSAQAEAAGVTAFVIPYP